jgi:hypothetical protein
MKKTKFKRALIVGPSGIGVVHFREFIKNGFNELSIKLGQFIVQSTTFPFLNNLSDIKNTLETASQKDFNWIINDLSKMEDDLLNQKESLLDPIIKFMEGTQKSIYEDAKQFLGWPLKVKY